MLSPLGLHNKPGVLLWNAYFIVQNVLIFREASPVAADQDRLPQDWPMSPLALSVVVGAMAWPAFEAWGYCDHWPAWSVYAPRVERTRLLIHRSEKEKLPTALERFMKPSAEDDGWFVVQLDRWSLEALNAPIYPQNRFQIAVAAAVCRQFGLTHARVIAYSSASRWTGTRDAKIYNGLGEIQSATEDFVLGAATVRTIVKSSDEPPPLGLAPADG
jgi:hypothetical protein